MLKPGDLVRYTVSRSTEEHIYEVAGQPYKKPNGVIMVPIIRPCYPHNLGPPSGGEVPLNHLEKI